MVHQLILLLVIVSPLFHTTLLCTVTFNSTDFTITGPCPNHTVIVPVGSTVQYRCEYQSMVGYMPYWYIPALNNIPFLQKSAAENNDVNISSDINSNNGIVNGYTEIIL